MVARIEADLFPLGVIITSPDRIRCKITGRLREVDASIRTKDGGSDTLITIECRKRRSTQDVTWIEQLATKKVHIGATRTIAVSSRGFSSEAELVARHTGIDLRRLFDITGDELNSLMKVEFVLFPHKRATVVHVGIRYFRSLDWTMPDANSIDLILPPDTDVYSPIFANVETGTSWSINDLWLQVQSELNPFIGIAMGAKPKIRTACFPYPGNVTVETATGPMKLGDVLLNVALSLEVEQVHLESAEKVEYATSDGHAFHRIEFESHEPGINDWRVSLQIPKNTVDLNHLRTRIEQPNSRREK